MKTGGALTRTRLALTGVLVVTVTWVSLTRPLSPLFSYLHPKSAILPGAHARNQHRLSEARDYFRSLPKPQDPPASNYLLRLNNETNSISGSVKFVIVIITTQRPAPKADDDEGAPGYLLQTASKIHAEIHQAGVLNGSFLFVCNVDTHPTKHEDAVYLRDYIPFVELHGRSSHSVALQSPKHKLSYSQLYHNTVVEKERWDYIFCLHSAVALIPKTDYIMILEDDVIPLPDMSIVLQDVLERIRFPEKSRNPELCSGVLSFLLSTLTHSVVSNESETPRVRKFAFLKLYLPEKWRGFYLFDFLRMTDLASFAAVGSGAVLVLSWICSANPKLFRPSWLNFFEGVIFSLLVCFLVGRVNVNELRRASKHLYRVQPSPGCCTPAMLYPSDVVPFLMTWLAESPVDKPMDISIDSMAGFLGLPGLCVEPVLFRHIGMSSTLGHSSDRPEEFLLV